MAPWVSFDQIKSSVSVEALLESYGFEVAKRKGDELRLLCPFHEETTPSFCFNTNGKFYCFGCSTKGSDILDFVRLKEDYDSDRNKGRRQAAIFIAERFGLDSEPPPRRQSNGKPDRPAAAVTEQETEEDKGAKKEVSEETVDDETAVNQPLKFELTNLDSAHPYLFERGLTRETIEIFGLGYFGGKGTMQGRIVIPIHNELGELIAYAGRWPGDEGWPEGEDKYKLPKGFYKRSVLYNLNRVREYVAELNGLIVVEGFFDVYSLWTKGRRNVCGIMGSSVSSEQERLIVDTVGPRGRVLLAFDADEAGRRGMRAATERLASQVFVRTVELSI